MQNYRCVLKNILKWCIETHTSIFESILFILIVGIVSFFHTCTIAVMGIVCCSKAGTLAFMMPTFIVVLITFLANIRLGQLEIETATMRRFDSVMDLITWLFISNLIQRRIKSRSFTVLGWVWNNNYYSLDFILIKEAMRCFKRYLHQICSLNSDDTFFITSLSIFIISLYIWSLIVYLDLFLTSNLLM